MSTFNRKDFQRMIEVEGSREGGFLLLGLSTSAISFEQEAASKGDARSRVYLAQIQAMRERGKQWRSANAHREALISFNTPPNVELIMPISAAIAKKYVSTNEAGLELLKTMSGCSWDDVREPTLAMIKAALE